MVNHLRVSKIGGHHDEISTAYAQLVERMGQFSKNYEA